MEVLLRRCRTTPWLLLVVSLMGCMVPAATREAIVPIISEITPESCEQQLRSLVELGPRFAGDADETRRTVEYLEEKLRLLGYQVQREAVGRWRGIEQVNLIVEIEGLVDPTIVVEVGAHYDTVRNCPGADDNGSGVAGLLEIARVLVHHRPERTVRMCFFAAEEVGLIGSRAHVDRILGDSSRRVDGLLDLEMIGYRVHEQGSQDAPVRIPLIAALPHRGDFILVAGNFQSGGRRDNSPPLDDSCGCGTRHRTKKVEIDGVDRICGTMVVRIPEVGRIGEHDAAKPCLPVRKMIAAISITKETCDPIGTEIFQIGDIPIDAPLEDVS